MSEAKNQNFLHGAAILAAGVVIMKILGAIYKIPLGNILGDEGYALFLAAYNIYNVFLTLATAGLPVALSRMISEAHTQNRPKLIKRTFNVSLITFLVLGIISTLVMFLFPTELANMLHNVDAAQSIWALSPAVLLVCLTSSYRGYCQGMGNMTPTTVGQVFEVLAKVIVGLVLAIVLANMGHGRPVCSAGAIFGVTVGAGVALIYMYYYKRRYYKVEAVADEGEVDSAGKILKRLLIIGIPITIGSSVLSVINLVDTQQIMARLQNAAGFSYEEAKTLFGVYGQAQTLYNVPAAFITPFTISVVPAIAAYMVQKKYSDACQVAESTMRISTVVALPMGVGLAVLAYPIMHVLYPNSHEAGSQLLVIMGIASYFVCMALITNSILQASGNERFPIYSMIVGGLIKIGTNYFLVANPEINILGAPIGTLLCYLVMCVMNFIFVRRSLKDKPSLRRILVTPVISAAAMGASAWAVYGIAGRILGANESFLMMFVAMAAAVCVAVVVYLVMVIATRAITLEDMKLIPKGEKIAKLLHIR